MTKSNSQKPQYFLDKALETTLLNYRYAQGVKLFERHFQKYPFLKLNPKNLSNIGLLYDHVAMSSSKKKSFLENKARHYYHSALKLDSRFYPAWWGLGRIFWHNNDKRSIPYAKKAYRLAKKVLDTDAGQFAQNIALIYKKQGDSKKAEYWFKRGIEESPQEWGTYYNLMCFYIKNKPNPVEVRKLAKKLKVMLDSEKRDSRWLKEVYSLTKRIIKTGNF